LEAGTHRRFRSEQGQFLLHRHRLKGDARRFTLLAEQYRKAPEVTRKRLYLETMQQVLSSNQKVLAGRNNNILYLPLNGAGAPSAVPPVTQMPPVRSSAPSAGAMDDEERPARGAGREGGR
jgi:membrane protease subunit HflK